MMEPDAVAASAAEVVSSSPPHDHDLLPEIQVLGLDEEGPVVPPAQPPVLTDDLRDKIIKQVEYYFSDQNLPTDKFMLKYVSKNGDGFVPIPVIASFRKIKRLTQERSLIVEALKQSSFLVVSPNGKKVRRLHPMSAEVKDPMLRTVLVENLPEDHSPENIQKIFGAAGKTKNICIHDPQAVREPGKRTIAEKMVSGKLHALVEYETVEAAEKAVALLNNQQDWRFGMRVKLLKHADKQGEKKKVWRDRDAQKNHNGEASHAAGHEDNHSLGEHNNDSHNEKVGSLNDKVGSLNEKVGSLNEKVGSLNEKKNEGDQKEKNEQKYQNRRRGGGRGQKYHGTNGHGHGTLSSSYGSEHPKPPPGPKMPDGTKGFTMGRGRPLSSSPS